MYKCLFTRAVGPHLYILLPVLLVASVPWPPYMTWLGKTASLCLPAAVVIAYIATDVLVTRRAEGKELLTLTFVPRLFSSMRKLLEGEDAETGCFFVLAIFVGLCLLCGGVQSLLPDPEENWLLACLTTFLVNLGLVAILLSCRGGVHTFATVVWPALQTERQARVERQGKEEERGETKSRAEERKGQQAQERTAARELLFLAYTEYLPVVKDLFTFSMLHDFIRDHMGDTRSADDVKRAGVRMRNRLKEMYSQQKAREDLVLDEVGGMQQQIAETRAKIGANRKLVRNLVDSGVDPSLVEEATQSLESENRKLERLLENLTNPDNKESEE